MTMMKMKTMNSRLSVKESVYKFLECYALKIEIMGGYI